MIGIALSQEPVRNGERVRGNVTWRAEGSKTARKIEVLCRWRTGGRGNKHEQVVDRIERADPSSEATIAFDFEIPHWGPLSYSGKLLQVVWEIAVNVDLPMARDEHEVKPFDVVARPWDPAEWPEEDEDDEEEDENELSDL